MFIRDLPDLSLTTLKDALDRKYEDLSIKTGDVVVKSAEGSIRIGKREVRSTTNGLVAIAAFVGVPKPLVTRIDSDLTDYLMNAMLQRTPADAVIRVTDECITAVREPGAKNIEPRNIVDVATRVLTADARVDNYFSDSSSFGLDVVVHDKSKIGVHGDPKVGDITKAGLRFRQNVIQNLVPNVSPYMMRLVCTNGMEVADASLKVDARGNTVEEVLKHLEAAAERAFSRVERDIKHFYDMRNEMVENPERSLARMSYERGLSDRMRMHLTDRVPAMLDASGSASMFDIVNLITNTANDPAITREGARRDLQLFGGSLITLHTERCRTCASALSS